MYLLVGTSSHNIDPRKTYLAECVCNHSTVRAVRTATGGARGGRFWKFHRHQLHARVPNRVEQLGAVHGVSESSGRGAFAAFRCGVGARWPVMRRCALARGRCARQSEACGAGGLHGVHGSVFAQQMPYRGLPPVGLNQTTRAVLAEALGAIQREAQFALGAQLWLNSAEMERFEFGDAEALWSVMGRCQSRKFHLRVNSEVWQHGVMKA